MFLWVSVALLIFSFTHLWVFRGKRQVGAGEGVAHLFIVCYFSFDKERYSKDIEGMKEVGG